VGRARDLYESQDTDAARAFMGESDKVQDVCDERMEACVREKEGNPTGRALAYRYFKRVVSHAANVVTSIVMPLDKLDYFDEPDRPRGSGMDAKRAD